MIIAATYEVTATKLKDMTRRTAAEKTCYTRCQRDPANPGKLFPVPRHSPRGKREDRHVRAYRRG
jgi:hypothetical protein